MTRSGNDMKVGKIIGKITVSFSAVLCLCQCETQQTVTTRSTKYSVSGENAGGKDDSDAIRKKFTNHGFSVDKDGNFKADKDNLYGDNKARGSEGEFRTKDSKYGNSDFKTNKFKTPEYLKMQDFNGTKKAREDGNFAREGDFKKSGLRDGRKLFRNQSKDSTEYASYNTGQYAKEGKKFSSGNNRLSMNAMDAAPEAVGTRQAMGYKENYSLTKDSVKKMISPGTYSRAAKLTN